MYNRDRDIVRFKIMELTNKLVYENINEICKEDPSCGTEYARRCIQQKLDATYRTKYTMEKTALISEFGVKYGLTYEQAAFVVDVETMDARVLGHDWKNKDVKY